MRQVHLLGGPWPDAEASRRDLSFYATLEGSHPLPEVEAALHAARRAAAEGNAAGLARALAALGVALRGPDPTEPSEPAEPPTDDDVARVALDRAPDAGQAAPLALLGPFADHLDPAVAHHRRLWTAAVAASVITLHDDDDRSPLRSFLREQRHGGRAERARRPGWLAWTHAPLAPWALVAVPGGLGVRPLLPLPEALVPEGALDLSGVAGVLGPPREGGLLLARLVATPQGWTVRTAFALPDLPPPELLHGALVELLAPQRAAARALHLTDALRAGGHRLVAAAHAWAWTAYGAAAAG